MLTVLSYPNQTIRLHSAGDYRTAQVPFYCLLQRAVSLYLVGVLTSRGNHTECPCWRCREPHFPLFGSPPHVGQTVHTQGGHIFGILWQRGYRKIRAEREAFDEICGNFPKAEQARRKTQILRGNGITLSNADDPECRVTWALPC